MRHLRAYLLLRLERLALRLRLIRLSNWAGSSARRLLPLLLLWLLYSALTFVRVTDAEAKLLPVIARPFEGVAR